MKKILLALMVFALVVTSSVAYGADKVLLGNGNVALKAAYLSFTESALEDLDNDDNLYIGIEAYNRITPNIYVGMEIGYATSEGDADIVTEEETFPGADTEVTFIPIELNLKYALEAAPGLVIDFGAGPSYSWMKEEISGVSRSEDWLWGAQIFTDVSYRFGSFFAGLNGKYQFTENFELNDDEDSDVNANNWRIGGHVGLTF